MPPVRAAIRAASQLRTASPRTGAWIETWPFSRGIGSARAFGFGLLVIAPLY